MIHYITVGVALKRPPTLQQYRRYAIYGGTHTDAELTALQMAACTSVMPVDVVRSTGTLGSDCDHGGCTVAAPVTPHGALGCRCWPEDAGEGVYGDPEAWQISDTCPHHGTPKATGAVVRQPPVKPGVWCTYHDRYGSHPECRNGTHPGDEAVPPAGGPSAPVAPDSRVPPATAYDTVILSPGYVECFGCRERCQGDGQFDWLANHKCIGDKRRGILAAVRRWWGRSFPYLR